MAYFSKGLSMRFPALEHGHISCISSKSNIKVIET